MKKAICIISLLILTSCATTTNTQAYIPPSEMKQNSQIIISREDAFLYSGVSANIRLNGNKVGSLAKGASQTFYAPPGRNFISVTGTGSPGESTMSFSTKKGEKYFNYIDRLKNSKLACKVKLADLTDNYIRRKQYKFASKIDMQKIKKYKKAYKILTGNSLKSAIKHF